MGTEVRISPPPVFDFERLYQTKEVVREVGLDRFPSLRVAYVLWLYNSPQDQWKRLGYRMRRLYNQEVNASDPRNPLPTIGFEVEVPRIPFREREIYHPDYALFFDALGIPRNKINTGFNPEKQKVWNSHWEFSPQPSYSAGVQNRILCELIKGGFIPSLGGSKSADDRFEYLDNEKLVSLHISLGVPDSVLRLDFDQSLGNLTDVELLASSFTLAYTSSKRFFHRQQQTVIAISKGAEQTAKNEPAGSRVPLRIEIKALEVGTESTYRMINEIQVVAASMFANLARKPDELVIVWDGLREGIESIYNDFGITPSVITQKEEVSKLVEETDISKRLRAVLTEGAKMYFPRMAS